MLGQDFDRAITALACYQALRAEGHRGMASVGMVFHNRAKAGWFNGSVYENAVAHIRENPSEEFPDSRDPQFQNLLTALDNLENGRLSDRTNGALYFTHIGREEVIKGEVVAQVGQTLFFK